MTTVYEIPLNPRPEKFTTVLNGVTYTLATHFANAPDAGWLIDIGDGDGAPIACGLPLVTGADMLAQFAYLGIGGILFTLTDGAVANVPTFDNLGVESHLYFEA